MASGELSDDLDENVNEKGQVNIDNEDAISHKSIRSGNLIISEVFRQYLNF